MQLENINIPDSNLNSSNKGVTNVEKSTINGNMEIVGPSPEEEPSVKDNAAPLLTKTIGNNSSDKINSTQKVQVDSDLFQRICSDNEDKNLKLKKKTRLKSDRKKMSLEFPESDKIQNNDLNLNDKKILLSDSCNNLYNLCSKQVLNQSNSKNNIFENISPNVTIVHKNKFKSIKINSLTSRPRKVLKNNFKRSKMLVLINEKSDSSR